MTRFHFPRETRAARLKVLLAQPGRSVSVGPDGETLTVLCENDGAVAEFERQYPHALAIQRETGRVVRDTATHFTIYLEQRQ